MGRTGRTARRRELTGAEKATPPMARTMPTHISDLCAHWVAILLGTELARRPDEAVHHDRVADGPVIGGSVWHAGSGGEGLGGRTDV
jgi:hypothetical protein